MPARILLRDELSHPSTAPSFATAPAVLHSAAMQAVMAMARRMAVTDSPILITGESGSGKELVARAIHEHSTRALRPFIDINCAALPEHLVESEFFGYERGAFSGADQRKPGLFEAASRGTLLLDEIGELDPRIQAKLLRVLDGQPYFRLGGTQKCPVDARIVAATNRPLDELVDAGTFRRDLYHRLAVLHLHVPPLRQRPEDIEPLALRFLRPSLLGLSPAALAVLRAWSWPGNVRELKNVLLRAALFARGPRLEAHDLPSELLAAPPSAIHNHYSLGELEEKTIRRALETTSGHQQRAAEMLGISRRTLIRKLKQYRAASPSASNPPAPGDAPA
jgi:transcriptional regulator with PAS, ATPase and Fis domain